MPKAASQVDTAITDLASSLEEAKAQLCRPAGLDMLLMRLRMIEKVDEMISGFRHALLRLFNQRTWSA